MVRRVVFGCTRCCAIIHIVNDVCSGGLRIKARGYRLGDLCTSHKGSSYNLSPSLKHCYHKQGNLIERESPKKMAVLRIMDRIDVLGSRAL